MADLVRDLGMRLKVSTVVTSLTKDEDMSEFILTLRPERWKLFQCLYIEGENSGRADHLLVSREEFQTFVKRHEHLTEKGIHMYASTEDTKNGYACITPAGCFLSDLDNTHKYSRPILQVGVRDAWGDIDYRPEHFRARGGLYDWAAGVEKKLSDGCGGVEGDIEDLHRVEAVESGSALTSLVSAELKKVLSFPFNTVSLLVPLHGVYSQCMGDRGTMEEAVARGVSLIEAEGIATSSDTVSLSLECGNGWHLEQDGGHCIALCAHLLKQVNAQIDEEEQGWCAPSWYAQDTREMAGHVIVVFPVLRHKKGSEAKALLVCDPGLYITEPIRMEMDSFVVDSALVSESAALPAALPSSGSVDVYGSEKKSQKPLFRFELFRNPETNVPMTHAAVASRPGHPGSSPWRFVPVSPSQ